MHSIPFPEKDASNLIAKVVRETERLWIHYPQYSSEDAEQTAMLACIRKWPKFDPSRGAPSNFIVRASRSAVLDLLRQAKARTRRDGNAVHTYRQKHGAISRQDAELPAASNFRDGDLAEQLTGVYFDLCRGMSAIRRVRGRPFADPARTIALAWLRKRLNLSERGGMLLLTTRPELARAVGLTSAPTRYLFANSQRKWLIIQNRLRNSPVP